ncbi:MAG TPA: hypothetical protein VFD92_13355 [Candidatus Binatia bacterium]|nr:hypothetical protein [Candidatus Binatia bacterium]
MRYAKRELVVAIAVAVAPFLCAPAFAQDDTHQVSGVITWISEDAVEVGGQRGLFEDSSDVRSDGRPVSRASVRAGMPAQMETDAAGRVLELRVNGVVE